MDITSALPSLAVGLAFCTVFSCAVAGFRIGTSGERSNIEDDIIGWLVVYGLLGSIVGGLLDWAVIYNQGAFELSMLCWLFISSGFFAFWLAVGLAIGPVEKR